MSTDTSVTTDANLVAWPKTTSQASAFLDHLYAAAFDPEELTPALHQFAAAFASDRALVFVNGDFLRSPAVGEPMLAAEGSQQLLKVLRECQPRTSGDQVLIGQASPTGAAYLALVHGPVEGHKLAFVALRSRLFAHGEHNAALALLSDVTRAVRLHHEARMNHAL